MTTELEPIPVPGQLRNPHSLVKRLQGEDSLQLAKAVQPRAFRLIQALLAEAERRGYRTRFSQPGQQYGRNRGYSADEGHFIVAIHGHEFGVRLSQEVDRTPMRRLPPRSAAPRGRPGSASLPTTSIRASGWRSTSPTAGSTARPAGPTAKSMSWRPGFRRFSRKSSSGQDSPNSSASNRNAKRPSANASGKRR